MGAPRSGWPTVRAAAATLIVTATPVLAWAARRPWGSEITAAGSGARRHGRVPDAGSASDMLLLVPALAFGRTRAVPRS